MSSSIKGEIDKSKKAKKANKSKKASRRSAETGASPKGILYRTLELTGSSSKEHKLSSIKAAEQIKGFLSISLRLSSS